MLVARSLVRGVGRVIGRLSGRILDIAQDADWIWQSGFRHEWQDGSRAQFYDSSVLPEVDTGSEPAEEPADQDVVQWPDYSDLLWPDGSPVQWPGEAQFPAYQISLDMDGVDDFVFVEDNDIFHVSQDGISDDPFSIVAWVKPRDFQAFRIASKVVNSGDREWLFGFNNSNSKLAFWLFDDNSGDRIQADSDYDFTGRENEWIHVAAVYDGSGTVGGIKLYVDGVLYGDVDGSGGTYVKSRQSTAPMRIGKFETSHANGQIAEVKMFRSELQPYDVGRLFMDLASAPTPDIAWYPIQELQGDIVVDTVNGNNGERRGDATWVDDREEITVPGPGEVYVEVDGITDQVVFPMSVTWDLDASQMSVCFWMQMTTTGQSLLSKDGEFDLRIGASGNLEGFIYSDGSNYIEANTGLDLIPQGEWVHLCLTWQADDESSMRLYINGVDRTANRSETGTFAGVTVNPLNPVQTSFKGAIDGLQIYARVITTQEVEWLYLRSSSAPTPEVSDYRFDRGFGRSVGDYVNGYTGQLVNAVWRSNQTELLRYVADLDGVDDTVEIAYSAGHAFGDETTDQAFSIMGWFKPVEIRTGNYLAIASKTTSDGASREFTFGIYLGRLMLTLYDGAGSPNRVGHQSVDTLESLSNEWHHYAATYDGSGVAGGFTLYIDGVAVSSNAGNSGGTYVAMHDHNLPISIGRFNNVVSEGKIGSFKLYGRELTASEIDSVYRIAIDAPTPDLVNLDFSGTGTTVANSGSEPDGVLTGAIRYDMSIPDERTRYHLDFDGVDDYVDLGTGLTFGDGATDEAFSISAWVRGQDITDFGILSKLDSDRVYTFRLHDIAGELSLALYDGGLDDRLVQTSSGGGITADEWYHVAATYDGSSTVGGIKLYINGEEASAYSSTTLGTYVAMEPSSENVTIGKRATSYADGGVAELKIYGRELSAYEVDQDYRRASDAPTPDVAEYLIGNETGNTLPATVGDDGTIHGALWADEVFASETDLIALEFSGANGGGHVSLGTNDAFSINPTQTAGNDRPMSIAAWIWMDVVGGGFRIASQGDDTVTRAWLFGVNGFDGELSFIAYQGGANPRIGRQYSLPLYDRTGEWLHVVATYDGSATNGGIALYLDGVRVDDIDNTAGSYTHCTGTGETFIGKLWDGSTCDGKIRDIRFFNTALDPQQVGQLFSQLDSAPTPQIAHYRLQEGKGSKARDVINRYDGDLVNAPVWFRDTYPLAKDVVETSLSFDGVDDYVDLGEFGQSLNFGDGTTDQAFSVTGWVRLDDTDTRIISKSANSSARDFLVYTISGRLFAYVCDVDVNNRISVNGLTTNLSGWVHFAFTYDGSGSTDGLGLYVNGVDNKATSATTGTYTAMHSTSNPIHIGRSGSVYRTGEIGEIKIFGSELSAAEVASEYAGNGPTPDILHLPFDEGAGIGLKDLVNGNSATIEGATWVNYDPTARSLYFNDRDSVSLGDGFNFGDASTDQPFSMEAWVKTEDSTDFVIASKQNGFTTRSWHFRCHFDEVNLTLFDETSAATLQRVTSSGQLADEQEWHHVVATYDGSSTSAGINLYIDGVVRGSTDGSTGSYVAMHSSTDPVKLGVRGDIFAKGQIGDYRIYDCELTASEVADAYAGIKRQEPIATYRFEEGSGTTTVDGAGDADGTFTSLGWRGVDDLDARALSLDFDGINDEVDIGTSFSFSDGSVDESFTLACWVKLRENSAIGISGKGGTGNDRDWIFYTNPSRKLTIRLYDGSSTVYLSAVSVENVRTDEWSHVAVTYDGSAADSGITLYINGIDDTGAGAGNNQGSYVAMENRAQSAFIGSLNPSNYADGKISDFRIYGSELTATEIRQLANQDINAPVPDVAHYPFDESYGTALENKAVHATNLDRARTTDGATFDGTDDYLTATTTGVTTSLSIEMVLKLNGASRATIEGIVTKWNVSTGDRAYAVFVDTDNTINFRVSGDGATFATAISSALSADRWYKVRCTFDTSSSIKIYVDDVEEASETASIPVALHANAAIDLKIGNYGATSATRAFRGNLSYVSIGDNAGATDHEYIFDKNYGATVPDQVGSGDLTYQGSDANTFYSKVRAAIDGATWARSIEGATLDQQNSTGYFAATTSNHNGALTLEAVFKYDGSPMTNHAGLICKRDGSNQSFLLGFLTNKHIAFTLSEDGTYDASLDLVGPTALNANQWYRVQAVFVPSTSMRIYIDGVLEIEKTSGVPASINANASIPLWVGVQFTTAYEKFSGQIAYAAVNNHAAYLFDRDYGDTVPDISGNGHDLVYQGSDLDALWAEALKRR